MARLAICVEGPEERPRFHGRRGAHLALGIGANTTIFSAVQNVLLRPLPYPQPERLVEIWNTYPPIVPQGGLSPGHYADWRRQNASFSSIGANAQLSAGFNLTGEGDAQRILVGYASSDVFPMLGVQMAAGRFFLPEEDLAGNAPVMILTSRLWQSRVGGNPGAVGRTIALDNRRYAVAGILPASFNFLRWPDLWMPLGQFDDDLTEHIHHAFVGIARLKPGLTLAQAKAGVTTFQAKKVVKDLGACNADSAAIPAHSAAQ